jgi:hypothetical protein
MSTLFTENQWIGEFFIPDQYEKRFPAKIDYSPESGVILSYSITGHHLPSDSDVVHGVLHSGDKCTLVGKFEPQRAGISVRHGLTTRPGKAGFSVLLIGDFITHDELFSELDFSLTSMQEFFFSKGRKDLEKYSGKPLFEQKTSYGSIEVGSNATFGSLHKDITVQIYSRNTDALERLKVCFNEVEASYPDACFMLKKDISYRMRMKFDAGLTIRNAYSHISDVADLFAILIYNPVYPESIRLIKKGGDDHQFMIEVYPSLFRDKRTIDLCTKDQSHFHIPIAKSKIDLAAVLSAWLSGPNNHSTIVSSIQNETGFRDQHSLHGEIVLYATQFESISNAAAIKKQKYEYPLTTYGCAKITNGLKRVFATAGVLDVGKGIGDLRNEIAHVGKPRKLLNSFSMGDLVVISQCLQVTIIGYILHTLGLQSDVILAYQNTITPDVP